MPECQFVSPEVIASRCMYDTALHGQIITFLHAMEWRRHAKSEDANKGENEQSRGSHVDGG